MTAEFEALPATPTRGRVLAGFNLAATRSTSEDILTLVNIGIRGGAERFSGSVPQKAVAARTGTDSSKSEKATLEGTDSLELKFHPTPACIPSLACGSTVQNSQKVGKLEAMRIPESLKKTHSTHGSTNHSFKSIYDFPED